MDATVVVVPRERFTSLPVSLRSLFATIPESVQVIVVEGASPNAVRGELEALKSERDFTLVSEDRMLLPNEARNIGGRLVDTKYIIFADNDIEYSDHWLEPLVAQAEAEGSDTVAPLTLIGPSKEPRIHHAGGRIITYEKKGEIQINEIHRLSNVYVKDADFPKQAPMKNEVCEFHCMLIKREFFDAMGGFDERYITREHIDLALRLRAIGGKSTFCVDSVVSYQAMAPFTFVDLRYLAYRWNDKLAESGLRAFSKMWETGADGKPLRRKPIRRRRWRAIMSWVGLHGKGALTKRAANLICPMIEFYFTMRDGYGANRKNVFAPKKIDNPVLTLLDKAA
ncbi:MAG: glycosyltransferase [Pseudomonadota bacterium]